MVMEQNNHPLQDPERHRPSDTILAPKKITLTVLSPNTTEIPHGRVVFSNVPVTTSLSELKDRLCQEVSSCPQPDRQRLIYRGRPLLDGNATLLEVFALEVSTPLGSLPLWLLTLFSFPVLNPPQLSRFTLYFPLPMLRIFTNRLALRQRHQGKLKTHLKTHLTIRKMEYIKPDYVVVLQTMQHPCMRNSNWHSKLQMKSRAVSLSGFKG